VQGGLEGLGRDGGMGWMDCGNLWFSGGGVL